MERRTRFSGKILSGYAFFKIHIGCYKNTQQHSRRSKEKRRPHRRPVPTRQPNNHSNVADNKGLNTGVINIIYAAYNETGSPPSYSYRHLYKIRPAVSDPLSRSNFVVHPTSSSALSPITNSIFCRNNPL